MDLMTGPGLYFCIILVSYVQYLDNDMSAIVSTAVYLVLHR